MLIVEPDGLFRAAIARLLAGDQRIKVVGEAENGLEAIDKISSLEPDVVLMDLRMPDLDGIVVARRILTENPDVRVLIVTDVETDTHVRRAFVAGSSGYILKDSQLENLASAVLATAAGVQVMSAPVLKRLLDMMTRAINPREFYDGLSRREIEILRMIATGMRNKQIAYKLKVSDKTVRNHVSHIYGKVRAVHRSQAIVYAWSKGLVDG